MTTKNTTLLDYIYQRFCDKTSLKYTFKYVVQVKCLHLIFSKNRQSQTIQNSKYGVEKGTLVRFPAKAKNMLFLQSILSLCGAHPAIQSMVLSLDDKSAQSRTEFRNISPVWIYDVQGENIILSFLCRLIAATSYSCVGSRYVQLIHITKTQ